MTTEAYRVGTVPGVSFSSPGELASPNYDGISRAGTYRGTAGALPGSASTNNIPSTYKGQGVGEVDIPYKTIDVSATPVEGKRLNPTTPYERLPTTTPSGYLPGSRASSAPSLPESSFTGRGLRMPRGGLPLDTSGTDNAFQKGMQNSADYTADLDKKYGHGYNPDYVDHGPIYGDQNAFQRMGYANAGEAWKDAAKTLKNAAQNALRNLGNWFNPNRYRDPPHPTEPRSPQTGQRPPGGLQDGVLYRVRFTTKSGGNATPFNGEVLLPGPIGDITVRANPQLPDLKIIGISYRDGNYQLLANVGNDSSASITDISRADGQFDDSPTYQPNRTNEPESIPGGLSIPNFDVPPLSTPAPTPISTPTPTPTPTPELTPNSYPFPNFPGLPSPNTPAEPTQNPNNYPSDSPTPSPLNTPGQSPSTTGDPLKAPSLNPDRSPTISLNPQTRQFNPPNIPNAPTQATEPNCSDPCVQKLNDKADAQKPVEISVKVFKACKTDTPIASSGNTATTTTSAGGTSVTSTTSTDTQQSSAQAATTIEGNAIFETKKITVPKAEADNYKLLYERIANLEAMQCNKATEAIAAVPEWWQLRPEAQRPQLVILFAEVKSTGKLGDSRWSLSIPHYNRPRGFKPRIPDYDKGSWEGILTLKDNSKIIVNAKDRTECSRVLNALKINIPVEQRVINGKAIKAKIGERINSDLKQCRVTAVRADFFSTGQRNLQPDWSIDLRKK